MVELNCQPIKTYNIYHNQKLAFSSENSTKEDSKIKEEESKIKEQEKADSVELKSEKTDEEKTPEIKTTKPERKFSYKNAMDKFSDGVVLPFKKLMSDPKAMFGTVAAGYLIKKGSEKSKTFSIFAVTATSLFGAFNLGKGITKFVKSENVEAKENSFEDMGKGTLILGLSALPATTALRQNNVKIKLSSSPIKNYLTALGKCWKESCNMTLSFLKTGKASLSKPKAGMSIPETISIDAGSDAPGVLGQIFGLLHTLVTNPMSLFAYSVKESGADVAANKLIKKIEIKKDKTQ